MNSAKKKKVLSYYHYHQSGGALAKFKSHVLADGGVIGDEEWIKLRLQHAKDNNYLDGIKVWISPSFGYKAANGFVSTLYDLINPKENSHTNNTGSQRPAIIENDETINNKPSILGDGDDDYLVTTHSNEIIAAEVPYCNILVFKPVTHQQDSLEYIMGQRTASLSPACGLRQHTTGDAYRLTGIFRQNTGTHGYVLPVNIPTGSWSIMLHRGSFVYINATSTTGVGNLLTDVPMLGSAIFGSGSGKKTNFYLAERMLVQTDFGTDVASSLRSLINSYYNVY